MLRIVNKTPQMTHQHTFQITQIQQIVVNHPCHGNPSTVAVAATAITTAILFIHILCHHTYGLVEVPVAAVPIVVVNDQMVNLAATVVQLVHVAMKARH